MQVFADAVEGGHAGVGVVGGAEHPLGHISHIFVAEGFDGFHCLHGQNWVSVHVGVFQSDLVAHGDVAGVFHHIQHRGGPEQAGGGVHVFGDLHGVGFVHVASQRSEISAAQHYGVTGRGGADQDAFQALGLFGQSCALGVIHYVQRNKFFGSVRFDHFLRSPFNKVGVAYLYIIIGGLSQPEFAGRPSVLPVPPDWLYSGLSPPTL